MLASSRPVIRNQIAACPKFLFMTDFAPAFGQGFGLPLLHGGMRDDMIDPCLRRADIKAIGSNPPGNRRKKASAAQNALPASQGPPKRASPSSQSSLMRAILA